MGETPGRMNRDDRVLPPVSGGQEDPEEIRENIEETRDELSETIDAIEERLSPQRLKEDARQAVREQTIGRAEHMVGTAQDRAEQAVSSAEHTARSTGSSIVQSIKQNPMPAALIGVGLGWLVMESRGNSSQPSRQQPTQSSMGQAQQKASQFAGETQQQAQNLAHQAQQEMGQMSSQAQQQVQQARSQFDRMLHENPVAVGAVALGLGAAVGLAIPESRKENQLMGEKRDAMVHTAEQKVGDTMHKVQQTADDALQVAQDVKQQLTG